MKTNTTIDAGICGFRTKVEANSEDSQSKDIRNYLLNVDILRARNLTSVHHGASTLCTNEAD